MKTEPITNCCPKCQAPLAADAPQGLCAKCLLAAAATPTEAGQPPGERSAPPPLEAVAAAFPQLEIVEIIGHGGMGVVYKARQPKLDRFVALKILPQSLAADAAFAERFNREARVLARLNHPNIVTVHDFGQSGGFFFLLMEFVDGVNLRQAMQAGRFTPQQAMMLVPKICEALQFAHDEGILHRDIKPENILLDTRGRVKIADFGIAKLVGEAREKLTLTASGMAVGTPHYMAPEQLEHPQDVDQRADIYSLGVVFYEMLTEELPIGRFAAPSTKSAVDPRVDDVVFHALEKEREKRFHSATEVRTSVEAITAQIALRPGQTVTVAAPVRPGSASGVPASRVPCYFNTPARMRDCFPSAAARVFTCRGELALEGESLTFTNAWRTTITIPLKDIEDLSVGQFQLWTTPWVMKYARISFLSATFRQQGQLQTVHLTPVEPGATSAARINDCVGRWFEWVRQAASQCTGKTPRASDTAAVSVSAEPAWNRKALPLVLGCLIMGIVTWVLQARMVQGPIWLASFTVVGVLITLLLWFSSSFMRANSALGRGQLDAVTSNDPPSPEPAGADGGAGANAGALGNRARRPFWWTVSAAIFVAIGVWAVVDTLVGLYSRPITPAFYYGFAHLFAGIAMLTLSRRWRAVALAILAVAVAAGALITIMMAVVGGSVSLPAQNLSFRLAEKPWWAAAAAVRLAVLLGWPCYMLLSARGRRLFERASSPGAGGRVPYWQEARWAKTSWLTIALFALAVVLLLMSLSYSNRYIPPSSQGAAAGGATLESDGRFMLYTLPGTGAPLEPHWKLKHLKPANHLARVLFVRWTNGVPILDDRYGFSSYFKVGPVSMVGDFTLSCERAGETNKTAQTNAGAFARRYGTRAGAPGNDSAPSDVKWTVSLLWSNESYNSLFVGEPPYRLVNPPAELAIRPGHQGVYRLAEYITPQGESRGGWSGVELRIFIEPINYAPARITPFEHEGPDDVTGLGMGWTKEQALKAIKEWPVDQ